MRRLLPLISLDGLEIEGLADFAIANVYEEWITIVLRSLDTEAAVIGDDAACSNGSVELGNVTAASAANNVPDLCPGYKRR